MASPYKALQIWVKRFSEYLAYEPLHRPDSWQGFLYVYLLSFPRFCIKRFPFLFLLSHQPVPGVHIVERGGKWGAS